MKGISRRDFIRYGVAAAGGAALALGVPRLLYAMPAGRKAFPDKYMHVYLEEGTAMPKLELVDKAGIPVIQTIRNPMLADQEEGDGSNDEEDSGSEMPEFIQVERNVKGMIYPVVIGSDEKKEYHTPSGEFEVAEIILKPDWYPPKDENGNYLEWVRPEHRNIADGHGGMIPYRYKEKDGTEKGTPLGEFKVRLKSVKTGRIVGAELHGGGDYCIYNGIWRDSHQCMRMKNEHGLEVADFIKHSGVKRFPLFIDELYP